ncbi:hypothetical protein [Paraburkholderia piptadeniae]|uniref:hypothetical protein n=1 Tax=Paraburkholderia piptadeniae TaxID=1701573 RepID=UPI000B3F7F33|nr:hypothetical protein [Paraburkholderia piptadeniae]
MRIALYPFRLFRRRVPGWFSNASILAPERCAHGRCMQAACPRDAPPDAAWRALHAALRASHHFVLGVTATLYNERFCIGRAVSFACRCLHLPFQAVRSTLLVMVLAALRLRCPPVRRDTDLR